MTGRTFPIFLEHAGHGFYFSVVRIPWDMIAPHEARARANHDGQSLENLANRGGLDAPEALAVLGDRPWHYMTISEANRQLFDEVQNWLTLRRREG